MYSAESQNFLWHTYYIFIKMASIYGACVDIKQFKPWENGKCTSQYLLYNACKRGKSLLMLVSTAHSWKNFRPAPFPFEALKFRQKKLAE